MISAKGCHVAHFSKSSFTPDGPLLIYCVQICSHIYIHFMVIEVYGGFFFTHIEFETQDESLCGMPVMWQPWKFPGILECAGSFKCHKFSSRDIFSALRIHVYPDSFSTTKCISICLHANYFQHFSKAELCRILDLLLQIRPLLCYILTLIVVVCMGKGDKPVRQRLKPWSAGDEMSYHIILLSPTSTV